MRFSSILAVASASFLTLASPLPISFGIHDLIPPVLSGVPGRLDPEVTNDTNIAKIHGDMESNQPGIQHKRATPEVEFKPLTEQELRDLLPFYAKTKTVEEKVKKAVESFEPLLASRYVPGGVVAPRSELEHEKVSTEDLENKSGKVHMNGTGGLEPIPSGADNPQAEKDNSYETRTRLFQELLHDIRNGTLRDGEAKLKERLQDLWSLYSFPDLDWWEEVDYALAEELKKAKKKAHEDEARDPNTKTAKDHSDLDTKAHGTIHKRANNTEQADKTLWDPIQALINKHAKQSIPGMIAKIHYDAKRKFREFANKQANNTVQANPQPYRRMD